MQGSNFLGLRVWEWRCFPRVASIFIILCTVYIKNIYLSCCCLNKFRVKLFIFVKDFQIIHFVSKPYFIFYGFAVIIILQHMFLILVAEEFEMS